MSLAFSCCSSILFKQICICALTNAWKKESNRGEEEWKLLCNFELNAVLVWFRFTVHTYYTYICTRSCDKLNVNKYTLFFSWAYRLTIFDWHNILITNLKHSDSFYCFFFSSSSSCYCRCTVSPKKNVNNIFSRMKGKYEYEKLCHIFYIITWKDPLFWMLVSCEPKFFLAQIYGYYILFAQCCHSYLSWFTLCMLQTYSKIGFVSSLNQKTQFISEMWQWTVSSFT